MDYKKQKKSGRTLSKTQAVLYQKEFKAADRARNRYLQEVQ